MAYTLKIRENGSQQEVLDPVRQKWVTLTPEERVRQIFILYLLNVKGFPLSHLSVEHAVTVNGMTQRYDLVVFGSPAAVYGGGVQGSARKAYAESRGTSRTLQQYPSRTAAVRYQRAGTQCIPD